MKLLLASIILVYYALLPACSQMNNDIITVIGHLIRKLDEVDAEVKDIKTKYKSFQASILEKIKYVGGREFKYGTTKKTWKDAEATCVKWGGHLLTVKSQAENDFFWKEIQKRNMGSTWIGATDEKEEGKWVWSNSGEESFYVNWNHGTGEPNGGRRDNCADIAVGWNGKWNDATCTSTYYFNFICERPKRGGQ